MQKLKEVIDQIGKIIIITLVSGFVLLAIIMAILLLSPLEPTTISGKSMTGVDRPNLINYAWRSDNLNLERGDVITFLPLKAGITEKLQEHFDDLDILKNQPFIKRIVAIEGDKIEIKDGKLILNGIKTVEDYTIDEYSGKDMEELAVPKNHIFVAGDYRYNSLDSRYFGPILKNSVTSEVVVYNNKYINKLSLKMQQLLSQIDTED